jgi:hypothetical protein
MAAAQSWVVLIPSNRVVCDATLLRSAVESTDWTLHASGEDFIKEIDHRSGVASTRSAILYGRIASPPFWAFLDALDRLVESGSLESFVFRHGTPPTQATTRTVLQVCHESSTVRRESAVSAATVSCVCVCGWVGGLSCSSRGGTRATA